MHLLNSNNDRLVFHQGSIDNLRKMFALADIDDVGEGLLAYQRYNEMMRKMADRYQQPLDRVIAAFVSLSPNNDYMGNLRSTISVLEGLRCGHEQKTVTVSTYNHCRDRAWAYLTGTADFIKDTRGPKIINFYHNLLDPYDPKWVTIDGHMVGAWLDMPITMKEAAYVRFSYEEIKQAAIDLAAGLCMLPNQFQATVWFTRKRVLRAKYSPQLELFRDPGDVWRTVQELDDLPPFPLKKMKENANGIACSEGR